MSSCGCDNENTGITLKHSAHLDDINRFILPRVKEIFGKISPAVKRNGDKPLSKGEETEYAQENGFAALDELSNIDTDLEILQNFSSIRWEHMGSKYRDHALQRIGMTDTLPAVITRSLHSEGLWASGLTLWECRGDKEVKYVSCVLPNVLPNSCGHTYYFLMRKKEVYRFLQSCNRQSKLAVQRYNVPTLEDGVLARMEESVISFLKREKEIRSYDVSMARGILLDGTPGNGKAQPLDALVYTKDGPKTMGDISIGDHVCTPSGGFASVIGVFPQGKKTVLQITFDNGDKVECCHEHLWEVTVRGKTKIVDTKYIQQMYKTKSGYFPLNIRVTYPVEFANRNVKLDPYLMGVLLGDGGLTQNGLRFSSADDELVATVTDRVKSEGDGLAVTLVRNTKADWSIRRENGHRYCPNEVTDALVHYGLKGLSSIQKFIPDDYIFNTVESRWHLLRGLMDTDGGVEGSKHNQSQNVFYTSSPHLAEDVKTVVQSLGGIVRTTIKERPTYRYKGNLKIGQPAYRLCVQFDDPSKLFALNRKNTLTKPRQRYKVTRIIKNVEIIGYKECKCILLDDKYHLYLTNNFVPTHNTMLCRYIQRLCYDNNISCSTVAASAIDAAFKNNTPLSDLFNSTKVTFLDDVDIAYFSRKHGDGKMACALLTAMDGMNRGSQLSVRIFTTNESIEDMDEAFLRPGRIDQRITIHKPSRSLRRTLVKKWDQRILENIDVNFVVDSTEGFSCAQVEAIKNFLVEQFVFGNNAWDVQRAIGLAQGKDVLNKKPGLGFASEIYTKPAISEDVEVA